MYDEFVQFIKNYKATQISLSDLEGQAHAETKLPVNMCFALDRLSDHEQLSFFSS